MITLLNADPQPSLAPFQRSRPAWMRHTCAAVLVVLLAVSGLLTTPSLASAATMPTCNAQKEMFLLYDGNGDAAIAAWTGSWDPFFYTVYPPAWHKAPGQLITNQCTLRYGNTGDGVKQLQFVLNFCYSTARHTGSPGTINLGFGALKVDGQFGSKTKAALIAVQKHHKLSASGVYDWPTARTMKFWSVGQDEPGGHQGPWGGSMCHTFYP